MSVISVNQKLATELGLNYDRESGIVAGFYNGYHIAFIMQNNLRQIVVSVSNGTGQMPEKEILKQAHKENKKVLSNPSVQGYRATYAIPNAMTDNGKLERSAAAAAASTAAISAAGAVPHAIADCQNQQYNQDKKYHDGFRIHRHCPHFLIKQNEMLRDTQPFARTALTFSCFTCFGAGRKMK